jgi:hypothetical protein
MNEQTEKLFNMKIKFDKWFYTPLNFNKIFQILIFFIIYIWLIYYIYSLFSFYQYFTSYSQYAGYIKSCDKNEIKEINKLESILLKHNTTEKYTYIVTIIIFIILVLIYSYIFFNKIDDLNITNNIEKLHDYINENENNNYYYIMYIIIYIIYFFSKILYDDPNILSKDHDISFNIVFNFFILIFLVSLKFSRNNSYILFYLIIVLIIINFIYNYISYNEDPDTKNFTNKKKINLDIIMNLLLYFFGIIISIGLLFNKDGNYNNIIKTLIHLFILIFIITFIFIIHYYSKFNNTLYNYDGFFGIKTNHENNDINYRNFIDNFTTTFYVLFIVFTLIILFIINKINEFDYIKNILIMFLIFTILLFITGGLYKGYKYHIDFTYKSYEYKKKQLNNNKFKRTQIILNQNSDLNKLTEKQLDGFITDITAKKNFKDIIKNYKQINNNFDKLNFINIPLFDIAPQTVPETQPEPQLETNMSIILIDNNNTFHNKQLKLFYDEYIEIIELSHGDEKKQKYMNDVKNYIINNISTKYYPYSYLNINLLQDSEENSIELKQSEEKIYNKITNLFAFIIITSLIISIIIYSYFKKYLYYYYINNLILILITILIIIIIIIDIYLKNI